jgi:hypothetical protein
MRPGGYDGAQKKSRQASIFFSNPFILGDLQTESGGTSLGEEIVVFKLGWLGPGSSLRCLFQARAVADGQVAATRFNEVLFAEQAEDAANGLRGKPQDFADLLAGEG